MLLLAYLLAALNRLVGRVAHLLTELCDQAEINLVLARVRRNLQRKLRAERRAGR